MIVWSGQAMPMQPTGGRFSPATGTWTPTTTLGAPAARAGHVALWIDDAMIVLGGNHGRDHIARCYPLGRAVRIFQAGFEPD